MGKPKTNMKKCGKVQHQKLIGHNHSTWQTTSTIKASTTTSILCQMTTAVVPSKKPDTIYLTTKKRQWVRFRLRLRRSGCGGGEERRSSWYSNSFIQELDNEEPKSRRLLWEKGVNEVDEVLSQIFNVKSWHWPSKQDNIKLEDHHWHRDLEPLVVKNDTTKDLLTIFSDWVKLLSRKGEKVRH